MEEDNSLSHIVPYRSIFHCVPLCLLKDRSHIWTSFLFLLQNIRIPHVQLHIFFQLDVMAQVDRSSMHSVLQVALGNPQFSLVFPLLFSSCLLSPITPLGCVWVLRSYKVSCEKQHLPVALV
uniref:Uncharacterized protein n=1 Tax=Pyxicephalus adspersus TaxID=30357 RepID=A0AAV3AG69_PYXAD|nr:TPA: hypothetical protein GDO54_009974 [Pyxicephalus adspersus]